MFVDNLNGYDNITLFIIFGVNYIEQQTMGEVRNPYLINRIYLSFQKHLSFISHNMTWMLTKTLSQELDNPNKT